MLTRAILSCFALIAILASTASLTLASKQPVPRPKGRSQQSSAPIRVPTSQPRAPVTTINLGDQPQASSGKTITAPSLEALSSGSITDPQLPPPQNVDLVYNAVETLLKGRAGGAVRLLPDLGNDDLSLATARAWLLHHETRNPFFRYIAMMLQPVWSGYHLKLYEQVRIWSMLSKAFRDGLFRGEANDPKKVSFIENEIQELRVLQGLINRLGPDPRSADLEGILWEGRMGLMILAFYPSIDHIKKGGSIIKREANKGMRALERDESDAGVLSAMKSIATLPMADL